MSSQDGFDFVGFRFTLFVAGVITALLTVTSFGARAVLSLPPFNSEGHETRAAAQFDQEIGDIRNARSVRDASMHATAQDRDRVLDANILHSPSIAEHIPEQGKFIGIDLRAMELSVYEDGKRLGFYPVLSKGHPGSHWETPTGSYQVLMKTPNHFSSIGGVFMPQSMQFFGNFFIHGWPYYPDGTSVAAGYSGGCIRLSDEDAKRVFAFAERGTPLFVAAAPALEGAPHVYEVRVRNRPPPAVSARSFIVADIASGAVFAERDVERKRPIASITKLMSAIVANETISFDRPIAIIDPHSEGVGDYGTLRQGEAFLVGDALYPLLLESNNAVAHGLARSLGEEQFLAAMNTKAEAIGMHSTHFADVSGISPESVSTARDLVSLARYLTTTKSFILGITRTKTKDVTAVDGVGYTFANRNHLVTQEFFFGGKTGFTKEAGETMLTVFDVPVGGGRATSTLAVIVLGSGAREEDTKALLGWFRGAAVAVVAADAHKR